MYRAAQPYCRQDPREAPCFSNGPAPTPPAAGRLQRQGSRSAANSAPDLLADPMRTAPAPEIDPPPHPWHHHRDDWRALAQTDRRRARSVQRERQLLVTQHPLATISHLRTQPATGLPRIGPPQPEAPRRLRRSAMPMIARLPTQRQCLPAHRWVRPVSTVAAPRRKAPKPTGAQVVGPAATMLQYQRQGDCLPLDTGRKTIRTSAGHRPHTSARR